MLKMVSDEEDRMMNLGFFLSLFLFSELKSDFSLFNFSDFIFLLIFIEYSGIFR